MYGLYFVWNIVLTGLNLNNGFKGVGFNLVRG